MCPFYLGKETQENADIVFLPYNYLIDKNARRAQGINVDNAIIIFDEAHNVESSCGDATSFEISSTDLSKAVREVHHCSQLSQLSSDFDPKDVHALEGVSILIQINCRNF